MEKLIELLNEYNKIHNYAPVEYYDDWEDWFETDYVAYYKTCIIISKSFWFIKWLVENDKIDLEIVKEKIWIPCFVWYTEWEISCVNDKEDYEQLLMLLSIQDEPIEFLVSILK